MLYFKCLSEFRSRLSSSNDRVFHDWRCAYSAGVNTAKLITFYDKPNVLLIIFSVKRNIYFAKHGGKIKTS